MRYCLLSAIVLLVSCNNKPIGESKVSQEEHSYRINRNARLNHEQLKNDLDSILMNRSFDFIVRAYQETYGHPPVRRYADMKVIQRIRPRDYYMNRARGGVGNGPMALASARTEEGWILVWSEREVGCREPREIYGCETNYRCELTVDREGYARLVKTTEFNDRKYPEIYWGYIYYTPDYEP